VAHLGGHQWRIHGGERWIALLLPKKAKGERRIKGLRRRKWKEKRKKGGLISSSRQ